MFFLIVIAGIILYSHPLQPLMAQSEVGSIKCIIKGEVIDRPQCNKLVLLKEGENPRTSDGISIPIVNGKFEYELNCNYEELYQLIFYDEINEYRPVKFISEQGNINFILYSKDQFDKNIVEGSVLNKAYRDFEIEGINKQKSLFEEMNTRIEQLGKDGTDISSVAKTISDSLAQELSLWTLHKIKEDPTIVGYSNLVQFSNDFKKYLNDISPIADVYQTVFAPKYPNHPYTERMVSFFVGSSFKKGSPFIDFMATDFNGKQVKLSERISGKPAVLHLWASWCSPCRQNGKELIPVYEEFRDKGFIVIGVARERGSSAAAESAVKQDQYPWENLVELNDTEQIWEKYGIGNAAGGDFLIDEKGIIVSVAPSIDEIRDFFKNR